MMELDRLARAVHLDVTPKLNGGWLVTGGTAPHMVSGDRCDCIDFGVHRQPCKHLLAVALWRADEEVLRALRLLVPMPKRSMGSRRTA